MQISKEQLTIKSLILSGLPSGAISRTIKSILQESINLKFVSHNPEQIMLSAAEYILAYLDLGFSYFDHKELFDHVLSTVGYTEDELHILSKRNHEIPYNKSRLQNLLGRWPKSNYNSHTKAQAVDEIIKLVDSMTPGDYWFYTSKNDNEYTTLFILQIFEDCAVIHDVRNNTFHRLIK